MLSCTIRLFFYVNLKHMNKTFIQCDYLIRFNYYLYIYDKLQALSLYLWNCFELPLHILL